MNLSFPSSAMLKSRLCTLATGYTTSQRVRKILIFEPALHRLKSHLVSNFVRGRGVG